mmetsp:Transcript_6686/g.14015  ORF Transcript_6686/g.14015 Transcript_6686/m.14015 type:complete len:91 (-) Transcript_6686:236-508(-)
MQYFSREYCCGTSATVFGMIGTAVKSVLSSHSYNPKDLHHLHNNQGQLSRDSKQTENKYRPHRHQVTQNSSNRKGQHNFPHYGQEKRKYV